MNVTWMLNHQNHMMVGLMGFLVFCFFLIGVQNQFKAKEVANQRQAILDSLPMDIREQVKFWPAPLLEAFRDQKITIEQGNATINRKLMLGMPVLCVQIVWGHPNDIDTKVSARGTTTTWKWFSRRNGRRIISRKVTFLDGQVESWET